MGFGEWNPGEGPAGKKPAKVPIPVKKKIPVPSGSSPGKKWKPPGSGSNKGWKPGGGGSGGGGYPGGGGGSVPSAPPPPPVPTIGSYLGTDEAYQQAVRGGKRSLADFLSELNRKRSESGTTFTSTKKTMETDRLKQLQSIRDEFASRGIIQSGLFGKEQGDFQTQFDAQRQALEKQQASLLADLLSQERNYKREQQLALELARQEALARRAQKYKIVN